jgi:hypothetical protein
MSGILIKFVLGLVLLWTCGPAAVRLTLVAYYSFDGAATPPFFSGLRLISCETRCFGRPGGRAERLLP